MSNHFLSLKEFNNASSGVADNEVRNKKIECLFASANSTLGVDIDNSIFNTYGIKAAFLDQLFKHSLPYCARGEVTVLSTASDTDVLFTNLFLALPKEDPYDARGAEKQFYKGFCEGRLSEHQGRVLILSRDPNANDSRVFEIAKSGEGFCEKYIDPPFNFNLCANPHALHLPTATATEAEDNIL